MRALICGGRDFDDRTFIFSTLDDLREKIPITHVIQGRAKGVDTISRDWAADRGLPFSSYPITQEDWDRHGRAAGPIRNQRMLDDGKPDCCIAFPGGRGTADMVKRAEKAGLRMYLVNGKNARRPSGKVKWPL